jgi:glycosyltransferase involved in cell wall biosynthesis
LTEEEDLGDSIVRILTDPSLRERLAANGKRTVAKKYDITSVAQRYEALYESLGG